MSAIVLGKRSSFFEDNNNNIPSSPSSSSSPPVSKRIRCSSSSPVRFSPTSAASSSAAGSHSFFNLSTSLALDRLASFFPDMDKQVLQRALDECGDDMDSAIRSLTELRLGSSVENMRSTAAKFEAGDESNQKFQSQGNGAVNGEAVPVENSCTPQNLPADGAEWVELFVREMLSAANMDDARSRASRALEWLEKSIRDHANADAHRLQQENLSLKEQLQGLIQENSLLKRAVSIQHERQKEFEDRSQEVHTLKQMISQYQEQLRTLEVNNYSLTMHLKQAQQSNSIPGRFHPDVF